MLKIRSLVFKAAFVLWTAWITVPFCFLIACPRQWLVVHLQNWAKGVMRLLRAIVGVRYEIIGAEHLPKKGPTLLISAHQSAWDTIIFHILTDDPCFIMKRALFWIPFYGWMAWKMGMVGIARKKEKGVSDLKLLREKALKRLREGRTVILFPEGTRVPPGKSVPYQIGAWALYKWINGDPELTARCSVVPVAVKSGVCWPKRGALKPGVIKARILPPIPLGLGKNEFMETLEAIREAQREL